MVIQSIHSAPYPGRETKASGKRRIGQLRNGFHDWDLEKAADILEVFVLLRNIDLWTVGPFLKRINEGVSSLEKSVLEDRKHYTPWKQVGKLTIKKPLKLDTIDETLPQGSQNTEPPGSPRPTKRRRTTRF